MDFRNFAAKLFLAAISLSVFSAKAQQTQAIQIARAGQSYTLAFGGIPAFSEAYQLFVSPSTEIRPNFPGDTIQDNAPLNFNLSASQSAVSLNFGATPGVRNYTFGTEREIRGQVSIGVIREIRCGLSATPTTVAPGQSFVARVTCNAGLDILGAGTTLEQIEYNWVGGSQLNTQDLATNTYIMPASGLQTVEVSLRIRLATQGQLQEGLTENPYPNPNLRLNVGTTAANLTAPMQLGRTNSTHLVSINSPVTGQLRLTAINPSLGDGQEYQFPVLAGINNVSVNFGSQPGVRRFKLCLDSNSSASPHCINSQEIFEIAAINAFSCPLSLSADNVSIGQAIRANVMCDTSPANLGADISANQTTVEWNPTGSTPGAIANQFIFGAAGTQSIAARSSTTFLVRNAAGVTVAPEPNATYVAPTSSKQVLVQPQAAQPFISVAPSDGRSETEINQPIKLDVVLEPRGARVDRISIFELGTDNIETLIDQQSNATGSFTVEWLPQVEGERALLARIESPGSTPIDSNKTIVRVIRPVRPLPVVRMDSPSAGTNFAVSSTISLRASITQAGADPVQLMQFYLIESGRTPRQVGPDLAGPNYAFEFTATAAGDYQVFARAVTSAGDSADSPKVAFGIGERVVLRDLSSPDQRRFTPNSPVKLTLQALQGQGANAPVAVGQELVWRIAQSNLGAAPSTCQPPDAPSGGTLRTDARGIAEIEFRAGCTSGGKQIEIALATTPQQRALTINLSGPDQQITDIRALGGVFFVNPGVPEPIFVALSGSSVDALQGGLVNWSLASSDGALSANTSTIDKGVANTAIILAAGVPSTQVQACVGGQNLCAILEIRSKQETLSLLVDELAEPAAQAAIDAPRAQFELLTQRLRSLRNESAHGFSAQVGVSVDGQGLSLGGSNQAESAENAAGEPAANDSQAQAAEDADSESEEVDVEAVEASRFGSFLLGNVGSVSEDRAGGDYEIRSRGITLGADYRVNKAIVVGLAVGGMRGGAESTNSEQDSRGYSVSSFVQWLPSQQWYVSGIFSSGKNNYETERFVSRGETLVPVRLRSEGNSTQNALLLESGYSLARKNLRFTPFVRYEFIRANIDALRESGGPGALLIADYQTQVSSLQAGLQTDWLINSRAGVFLPGLRVEFRKENDQRDQINARLIDSAFGIVKVRDNLVVDDFYGNAGLNLQWITGIRGQAVNFYFGLDYLFARAGFSGQNISLGAKIPF